MVAEQLFYRIDHRPYRRYAIWNLGLSLILWLGYSLSSFTSLACIAVFVAICSIYFYFFTSHYRFSERGISEYRLYRIHHMYWTDVAYTQCDTKGAIMLHTQSYSMVIVPYPLWSGPECSSALTFLQKNIAHIGIHRCDSIIRYTLWPF